MDNIRRDILWRVYLVYGAILIFALAIIGKVIHIQFAEGRELISKAEKQELRYFTQKAVRGNICAEDGSLMATSIPLFDIRMDVDSDHISDKFFYDNVDSLSLLLSDLFGDRSKYQYKKGLIGARKSGNRYYLLKRSVTYAQLKKLRQFPILRLGKYRGGLIVIPETKRQMPFKYLAKRTIGYAIESENLYVGLEGAFNDEIAGTDGKQLMRRINNGAWIPVHNKDELEPRNGNDIITSIDIDIQDVAEHALEEHLKEHRARQGCAILMEVETGFIKAIANLKYDSATGAYDESYNYAIAEAVEPGSTFKLASMLALLEDDKIRLQDTIDTGDGWMTYYGHTMKDAHKIGDGKITVREAFEKSSNVGISKLIHDTYREKPANYINHLYDIGLNKPLNISIPGEGKPFIKHPDNNNNWYGTTLPWMSIGYEVLLTPLQILSLYNAVANNGKLMKPLFVKEIRQAGQIIEEFKPEVLNRSICSKHTLDTLRSLLEGVVERGTATRLNNSIYKIAGKTGTAQIADKDKGYKIKTYNASFAGYFPADDPKYSCIVVVNRPSGGWYYGSSVAAPVFKEIADKVYATRLDIQMTKPEEVYKARVPAFIAGNTEEIMHVFKTCNIPVDSNVNNTEWSVLIPAGDKIKVAQRSVKQNLVPNVVGMGARDAVYLLEKAGLVTQIKGRGKVRSQSIKPGYKINKGSHIILELET